MARDSRKCRTRDHTYQHCRFFASRAAVDYLARFNTIGVLSLTIETSWLPELLEVKLACSIVNEVGFFFIY